MLSKRISVIILAVMLAAVCVAGGACAKKKEEPPKKSPPKAVEPKEEPEPEAKVYFYPFTGLTATSEAAISKRPLSIKIENSPEARPQMGLNSADVVYETRVEGNISRFNCIFQSNIPEEVGPVRSARLSDAWIVPQYRGMFYYSGSNAEVSSRLHEVKVKFGSADDLLHRVDFKAAPHNLYMYAGKAYSPSQDKKGKYQLEDIEPLYFGIAGVDSSGPAISAVLTGAALSEAGVSDGAIVSGQAIGAESTYAVSENATAGALSESDSATSGSAGGEQDESPVDSSSDSDAAASDSSEGAVSGSAASVSGSAVSDPGPLAGFTGEAAKSVTVAFMSSAKWEWDPDKKLYLRYTSGEEHMDGATDEQVWTDNVVVMYAEYSQANMRDPAGSPTYDTNLGGEGEAMIFRDGYMYKCTWKADEKTPPHFFDEDGNEIPLKQGKTWFEVPPTSGVDVTVE